MRIENQYIMSRLKKSVIDNIKSFLLLIPFFTLILTVILSSVLPTYNHYQFVKNGNHKYVYWNDAERTKPAEYEDVFVPYTQYNLKSHAEPQRDKGNTHYYKYWQTVDILLCHENADISNTMYTENNVIQSKADEPGTHIWISYELAKALNVKLGDMVYLTIVVMDEMNPRDLAVEVTGITRTKYEDQTPTKVDNAYGTGVLFFDDETFRWILERTMIQSMPTICFTDEALYEDDGYTLYTSKGLQLEQVRTYINSNFLQLLYIILCSILLIYVVVSLDISFTVKRQQRNLTILNMLGTPISSVRRILLKTAMMNSTISFAVAFLLVKFVFLQNLLHIYGDVGFMLICFLGYWVLCLLFTSIQTRKIKRI